MRVTAQLFNPPGRGEYLRKVLEMPDSAMPATTDEFSLRSVRAIKHFWPGANVGRAVWVSREEGYTVLDAGSWLVQWETSAYATELDKFLARFSACEPGANEELFARAKRLHEVAI